MRRMKHQQPRAQRQTVHDSMLLPLLDYAENAWGDRDNKVSIKLLQIHTAPFSYDNGVKLIQTCQKGANLIAIQNL